MERLRRWGGPGVPFIVSLVLSLSTVGSHVYWQDSGFYLNAVRDLGVLYPHGFVVYQILCKAWTLLFFFVDFVLAVHLFSSFCAAAAAAALAAAAREFLTREDRDLPAMAAGCLAAAGYTFWFSGIYAKVYALLYLVLALLLWAVVRTAKTPTKRGVAIVAVLSGLAWAVHPSVALGAVALSWYFLRAAKAIGWKPVAARLGLGFLVALGPGALLPVLSLRHVERSMGEPLFAGEVLSYLLGSRFTGIPGVFGLEGSRVASFGVFFWEEYLGVGLLFLGLGINHLVRTRKSVLVPGLAWMLPYVVVTILFKIEGQSDHWYVAACLPLTLAIAAGLESLAGRLPRGLPAAVAALALVWSVAANGRDLTLRGDDLAEVYGKLYLQNVESDGVLFANSDDVIATVWALQSVRGFRRDVVLVNAMQLGAERAWYDVTLRRHHPELRFPDPASTSRGGAEALVAGYLQANAGGRHPLYVTMPLPADLVPAGHVLVPQGVVWRLLPASEDRVDPGHWKFPMEPEDLGKRFKRKRGLAVTVVPGGFETETEPYERRLQRALVKGRGMLADWQFRHGQHATSVRLYESILPLDPKAARNETILHSMALSYLGLGRRDRAETLFRATLEVAARPWVRASSWLALGDLAKARGDTPGSRTCYEEASRIPGLTPEQQAAVNERLR